MRHLLIQDPAVKLKVGETHEEQLLNEVQSTQKSAQEVQTPLLLKYPWTQASQLEADKHLAQPVEQFAQVFN